MAEDKLSALRKDIELIDAEIVKALDKRTVVSEKIGKIKKESNLPVYDAAQEAKVIDRATSLAGKTPREEVEAVYRRILSASRAVQGKPRIAFLGPETTFTHMAALKEFGELAEYIPLGSISEVFDAVEKARADYGVVPVENSTEGTVNHTLDMFIYSDLCIVGETSIPVVHNLLSNSSIGEIMKVYSHPQALAQCRKWLSENLPKAEIIETSSTTKGAESASVYHSSAAVASNLAAEKFKLNILAENIGDVAENYTRFFVIGKNVKPRESTGKDKTSIMFSVLHKPGSLFNALKPMHDLKVNMTKIESRPTRMKTWEYVFFIDMQGFARDVKIKKVLEGMRKHCGFVKVLGSYPERAVSE